MTRKITISLPDDLAEEAQQSGNASAYIAQALTNQRRIRRDEEILAQMWGEDWNETVSPEDRARAATLIGHGEQVSAA